MLVHSEEKETSGVRKGGVEIMVETDCNKSSLKDEDFKIKDETEVVKEDITADNIQSNIDNRNEDSEKEVEEKSVKKRGRKRKSLDANKVNTEPKKLVKKYTKRKGKFFVNLKYCFLGV